MRTCGRKRFGARTPVRGKSAIASRTWGVESIGNGTHSCLPFSVGTGYTLMEGDEQAQQPRAWLNDLSPRQSSSSSPCEAFKAGSDQCACRYSSNATLLQPTPPCPRQMPPRQELIPSREEPHLELLRSPLRLFPRRRMLVEPIPEEPRRVAVLPRPVPVFPCLRCLSLPGHGRQEQCRGRFLPRHQVDAADDSWRGRDAIETVG